MHELSLAQSVVSTIEQQASTKNFTKVTKVVLEVGALSHVDAHALRFGFDAATRGTLIEDAVLDILEPPGTAKCFACEQDVTVQRRGDPCPACGSSQLLVIGGEDMKIKYLEVS